MPTHYQGTPEEILALDTWIKLTRAADSFGARFGRSRYVQRCDGQPVRRA